MNSPVASRRGSALMLALITIILLSSLIASFLFRVRIESDLAARHRFGAKAKSLSRSGLDVAAWMLVTSGKAGNEPDDDMTEEFFLAAKHLQSGTPVQDYLLETEDGQLRLGITPETGRRNINSLSEEDWEILLENSGVPEDLIDSLVDAFWDWVDEDQATRLNGAEEDDPFYEDANLPVKNGNVDHLDELLGIKGFTRSIVFGGTLDEFYEMPEVQVSGIAPLLTVYGDNQLQINAASREVLMSLSGLREDQIERLLEGRSGTDGELGTEDDGYRSAADAVLAGGLSGDTESLFTTGGLSIFRVTSTGEVANVSHTTEAILELDGKRVNILTVFSR